jgi:hypothetical protein
VQEDGTHMRQRGHFLFGCMLAIMLSTLQEAQDPESEPEVEMEYVGSDDTTGDRPVPGMPIREAITAIDKEDANLVYDHTRFRRDKVKRRYFRYYHERRIIVERGAAIEEFNGHARRIRAVLDAQGWTAMAEDHHPAMEVIVWEFYANIYQRRGNSFCTWLRGTAIDVTPALISEIIGVPRVRDPSYPYLVDHLPERLDLVSCFTEGCLHQMELEGEHSFQMSDFSNDVHCIYHILASRVLSVISHTMITIKRARCLYAMLTGTPHLLPLRGHFHHDVCPTFGQGFCAALWGPDCGTLRGGHDRVEGDSVGEGGHGRTLPQRESGPFTGGGARAEGTVTTEGS